MWIWIKIEIKLFIETRMYCRYKCRYRSLAVFLFSPRAVYRL